MLSEEEKIQSRKRYTKTHYWKHRARLLEERRQSRRENPAHFAAIKLKSETKDPIKYILKSSKYNAKKSGTEHTITTEDIVIPDVCPVFHTPFIRGTPFALSIDRIDSSKGYVPGNIQIISRKANTMKNNATADELRMFADWIINAGT